jgi:hypothetical protein
VARLDSGVRSQIGSVHAVDCRPQVRGAGAAFLRIDAEVYLPLAEVVAQEAPLGRLALARKIGEGRTREGRAAAAGVCTAT